MRNELLGQTNQDIDEIKKKKDRQELIKTLRTFRRMYGFRPKFRRYSQDDERSQLKFDKLNISEAIEVTRILKSELSKYPPQYIRFCHVNEFRVVKNLYSHRENNFIGGTVDLIKGSVFLSSEDLNYLKPCLHHELQHVADSRPLRILGSVPIIGRWVANSASRALNEEWNKLNRHRRGTYSRGYLSITAYRNQRDFDPEGFAKMYGTRDECEDRATIAEVLMSDPSRIRWRLGKDQYLTAKVDRMSAEFNRRSSGLMDEKWLQDALNGNFRRWVN